MALADLIKNYDEKSKTYNVVERERLPVQITNIVPLFERDDKGELVLKDKLPVQIKGRWQIVCENGVSYFTFENKFPSFAFEKDKCALQIPEKGLGAVIDVKASKDGKYLNVTSLSLTDKQYRVRPNQPLVIEF